MPLTYNSTAGSQPLAHGLFETGPCQWWASTYAWNSIHTMVLPCAHAWSFTLMSGRHLSGRAPVIVHEAPFMCEWSFMWELKYTPFICEAPFAWVEGTCTCCSHQWSCARMCTWHSYVHHHHPTPGGPSRWKGWGPLLYRSVKLRCHEVSNIARFIHAINHFNFRNIYTCHYLY